MEAANQRESGDVKSITTVVGDLLSLVREFMGYKSMERFTSIDDAADDGLPLDLLLLTRNSSITL
uniref:Uncharacterized protein n=1 Tax=Romanomermis culicivorax TaxID=13658 RepID=A0A915KMD6_ROMCU